MYRGPVNLSPEQLEEMIEKIAKVTIDVGMESMATLFLDTFRPLSRIGASIGIMTLSPWALLIGEFIGKESWGQQGMNLFLLMRDKSAVRRLSDRIEELALEKKEKEKERKELEKKKKKEKGTTSRWRGFFRRS